MLRTATSVSSVEVANAPTTWTRFARRTAAATLALAFTACGQAASDNTPAATSSTTTDPSSPVTPTPPVNPSTPVSPTIPAPTPPPVGGAPPPPPVTPNVPPAPPTSTPVTPNVPPPPPTPVTPPAVTDPTPSGQTASDGETSNPDGTATDPGGETSAPTDTSGGPPNSAGCDLLCEDFESASGGVPDPAKWSLVANYTYDVASSDLVQVSGDKKHGGAQALHVAANGLAGVVAEIPAQRFYVRAFMQVDAAPLGPVLAGIGTDHNSELRFRIQQNSWATINIIPGDAVLP